MINKIWCVLCLRNALNNNFNRIWFRHISENVENSSNTPHFTNFVYTETDSVSNSVTPLSEEHYKQPIYISSRLQWAQELRDWHLPERVWREPRQLLSIGKKWSHQEGSVIFQRGINFDRRPQFIHSLQTLTSPHEKGEKNATNGNIYATELAIKLKRRNSYWIRILSKKYQFTKFTN